MTTKTTLFIYMLALTFWSCNGNKSVNPEPPSISQEAFEGVIGDNFNGSDVAIYANSTNGLMIAFNREFDGSLLSFTRSNEDFPNVLLSEDGTIWNIFGEAVSGPLEEAQLETAESQMGYWFGFATFFPRVTLLGENEQELIEDRFSNNEWLIDPSLVITGAIKDGIPALNRPDYIQINSSNYDNSYYVDNTDLVSVVKDGSFLKVYPHKILDWHEIVNDEANGVPFALSYCPLTGTSDAWERTINGNTTTFGVSGFLYDNNLILYDRETDSLWPQLLNKSANGLLIGKKAIRLPVTEMTWQAVKLINSDIMLLSDNTGYTRNYAQYPYGTYKDVEGLLFPVTFEDTRVFGKERVLSVMVDGKVKAYRFNDFEKQ